MERKLKILYIANLITFFGSAFLFIPISKNFSIYFGVGMSWAMVYFIMRSPPVFLSRVYSSLANKYGLIVLLKYSQLLSVLASFVLLAGVYYEMNLLAIIGFILVTSFSLTLRSMYPSLLNLITKDKTMLLKSLADWKIVLYSAYIVGTGLGGLLYNYISINLFVVFDAATFFISFLLWAYASRDIDKHLMLSTQVKWSLKQFSKAFFLPLNLVIFFKKICYGFINPMFAVILFEKFHQSTAKFGIYFCLMACVGVVASKIGGRIKVSYNFCLITSFFESLFAILYLIANSVFLSVTCLLLAVFFMVLADISVQTLYLNKYKKEGSNNLSSIFDAVTNGGQLVGFGVFMIISHLNVFVISTASVTFFGIVALILITLAKFDKNIFDESEFLKKVA